MLAAERSAPASRRPLAARQRRDDRVVAAQQGDAAQLGAGAALDLGADAEGVEQREIARRDALTADLAPRKRLALDQRHRPAGAREQNRRRRPGRAGADDRRVEPGRRHGAAAAARRRSNA